MSELDLDLLTRVAFGEEEPGDLERLDVVLAAHPGAQAELDSLRALCSDLGHAAVVPPCQLGFSRVRSGLQAQCPPRRALTPAWLGLAAAALGLLWLFSPLATRPAEAPSVVAAQPAVSAPEPAMVASVEPEPSLEALLADAVVTDEPTTATSVVPAADVVARKQAPPRRPRPAPVRLRPTAKADSGSPMLAAAPVPDSEPMSLTVVLVTERADPTTGAAGAVESADSASLEFRG